jgi:hypothetical protein
VNFLKKIWQFVTGKKAQDVAKAGVALIDQALPLIAVFADKSGNTTFKSVIAGYEKVGLPVTAALRDGKLTEEELKAMAGLGVQLFLEKTKGATGTAAKIAAVLAFAQKKYGE